MLKCAASNTFDILLCWWSLIYIFKCLHLTASDKDPEKIDCTVTFLDLDFYSSVSFLNIFSIAYIW